MFGRLGLALNKEPATASGERIYAIGDIHGRLDLLRDLISKIESHHQALPPAREVHIVLLGDLVDRGPNSAGVLRTLYNIQQRTERIIVLRGNHEDTMLKAIDGEPGLLSAWKRIGGIQTLQSFEIGDDIIDGPERELLAALRTAVGRPMLDWLRNLPLTARSGDYLFCHAGIRPGVALKRQSRSDLLWIREEFLADDSDHGFVVVHGHSIATEVEVRDNRIGIDTGAYRTGTLTALYLEGAEREILTAEGEPDMGWTD